MIKPPKLFQFIVKQQRLSSALLALTMLALPIKALSGAAVETPTSFSPSEFFAQINAKDNISGRFTQERHISVLSLPLVSSGMFSYQQNDGLLWQTETPIKSTIKINQRQGVLTGADLDSLKVVPSSQILAEIFLGVFSGNEEHLSKIFTISPADKENYQVKLTPDDSSLEKYVSVIYLGFTDKQQLQSIRLQEANGDRSDIRLSISSQAQSNSR